MTPRERKVVVAGIALVVASVMLRMSAPVLRWAFSGFRARHAARATLAQVEALARSEESARTELDAELGAFRRSSGLLLNGGTSEEALSSLAVAVSDAAEASGVRIDQVQEVADSGVAGFMSRVTIRGLITGDTEGLASLFAALESAPVRLTIGSLRVVASDQGLDSAQPEALRLELDVHGWWSAEMGSLATSDSGRGSVVGDWTDHADSLVQSIVRRAPFRAAREPASRMTEATAGVPSPVASAATFALVLRGVLEGQGGSTAIIDGVPGSAGQLAVRAGDSLGATPVRVLSIDRGSVLVAHGDSSWRLVLRGAHP